MGINDKIDHAKGKAREGYGKATGDNKQEAKGKVEQVKSKVSETAKDVKDTITR